MTYNVSMGTLNPTIPIDEQLASVCMSTDTSSEQCSTRGYKWIQLVSGLHVSGVNAALVAVLGSNVLLCYYKINALL